MHFSRTLLTPNGWSLVKSSHSTDTVPSELLASAEDLVVIGSYRVPLPGIWRAELQWISDHPTAGLACLYSCGTPSSLILLLRGDDRSAERTAISRLQELLTTFTGQSVEHLTESLQERPLAAVVRFATTSTTDTTKKSLEDFELVLATAFFHAEAPEPTHAAEKDTRPDDGSATSD
jgi:hypothetical protein